MELDQDLRKATGPEAGFSAIYASRLTKCTGIQHSEPDIDHTEST